MKIAIAESIAPGQESLLNEVIDSDKAVFEDNEVGISKEYIDMYKESNAKGRMVILALQDHSKHSTKQLCDAFQCTIFKVKQARKLRKMSDGLVISEKNKHHRNRLDLIKSEHFIDFVF